MAVDKVEPFPILEARPSARLEALLPSQLYILDLLPPDQSAKLLAWCQTQQLEGPKPAKKGEAERTANRASLTSPSVATSLLTLLQPYLSALDPIAPDPLLSPNIRIYHYPPGTYFRGHYDTPQLDPASRRLSCWTVLIYLTDVVGGGTSFYPHADESRKGKGKAKQGEGSSSKGVKGKKSKDHGEKDQHSDKGKITVEAKAGRVLFHWHGVAGGGCMLHEGDEVIKGDKWVLRTDVLG